MNPQSEARAELVRRLRAHASIEDEGHRIDLNAAANEVEDLGKLVTHETMTFQHRLMDALGTTLREFIDAEMAWHGSEAHLMVTESEDDAGMTRRHFEMLATGAFLKIKLTVEHERHHA